MPTVLAILLTVQFLVIISHDWLDIPGLQYGSQVRRAVGGRKMLVATAINAIFPALAAAGAVYSLLAARRQPAGVTDYQVIYCGITLASAIALWWVPYFRGADEKTRRLYAQMYAGTRHLLPSRGPDGLNPRPNVL